MIDLKYIWATISVLRLGLLLRDDWLANWSYIQPDQFFQSTEPIAGHVLDTKVHIVWEFNASFPLRNIFFPQLVSLPVFTAIRAVGLHHNPWLLFVGPRLIITIMSFICDYSLVQICYFGRKGIQPAMPSLAVFGTSYITLTYLTQTFSNTIETILLSVLLWRVFESIATKEYSAGNAFIIGSVLSLGFFNRPTFVLFAMPSVLIWAATGDRRSKHLRTRGQRIINFMMRCLSLLPSFIITSMVLIIIDTLYYNQNGIELYENLLNYKFDAIIKSLVITPLNFAIYNTKTSNLVNHGLHPPYFHALVSVPMAFSLLGVFAYYDLWTTTQRLIQSIKTGRTGRPILDVYQWIALLTFLVPLLGFTLVPHQEPRFLIPILVPLCYLYANRLLKRKFVFSIWIIINLILVIFYAFIHQSGVIKGMFDLNRIIRHNPMDNDMDIIISRTYLPPRHLLSIDNKWTHIRIHDLSVQDFPQTLDSTLSELRSQNKTNCYLLMPSALSNQLKHLFTRHGLQEYKLVKQYFPHFTAEDLESSLNILKTSYTDIRDAFSLNLWSFAFK